MIEEFIDLANEEVERQRKYLRPNEKISLIERDGFLEVQARHVFYDRHGGFAEAAVLQHFDIWLMKRAYVGMEIGEGIRALLYKLRNEGVS